LISRRWATRGLQVILVSAIALVALGASDASARFDKDSRSMMCVCGCNELLSECNHVGCPSSGPMLTQLSASIARGDSDDAIFHQFQDQYGPVVLASPMFTRFNHFAWILPPLLLFLGLGGTMLIVRKWRLHSVPMPAAAKTPAYSEVRDRIRRETQL
jgi:cytochrome c-type biogenesis protein CcmH/NrfF